MSGPSRIERGLTYHIYNRGNNREELFEDPSSYAYFMKLVERHVLPMSDVYCYCLLRNHFHLLIRVRTSSELRRSVHPSMHGVKPSQHLSNCFNAFAKATNAARGRTGCLFERPFGRRLVRTRDYFKRLVLYIHMNPQAHGLSRRFEDWTFSSFREYVSGGPSYLQRATVIGLFGSTDDFMRTHESEAGRCRLESGRSDDASLALPGSRRTEG